MWYDFDIQQPFGHQRISPKINQTRLKFIFKTRFQGLFYKVFSVLIHTQYFR